MELYIKGELIKGCSVSAVLCGVRIDQVRLNGHDFNALYDASPEQLKTWVDKLLCSFPPMITGVDLNVYDVKGNAKGFIEPNIIMNGKPLSSAQAMTVRVALQSFESGLKDSGLGDDNHGRNLTSHYLARISEINDIILGIK